MKIVDISQNKLVISFRTETKEEFFDILSKVKSGVVGRVWNPGINAWNAPPIQRNIEYLQSLGFELTAAVKQFNNKGVPLPTTSVKEHVVSRSDVVIDESKLVGLFPYQIEGVKFLERSNGVGIIGDEMGLGKTVQALGYLKIHPEKSPALVVCPAVAKYVWYDASKRWLDFKDQDIAVLSTRTETTFKRSYSLYIINYDILKDWEEIICGLGIQVIIGDEVQYISNVKAQRTKSFARIARSIPHKIFLSGTPIKSYPYEFFPVLNLVAPKTFPNNWAYLHRYCEPKYNGFGWTFKGASNQEELRSLIEPLMIRREKVAVLPDLPPKLKQVVPLECEKIQLDIYNNADKKFREWVKTALSKSTIKNEIEGLKQLAYLAKRNSVLRWISDFLSSGNKLVVFAVHLHVLDDIEREFRDVSVRIDGGTKADERRDIEKRFQTDPSIKLFIGQVVAAGVGITLTAASSVAFVEFPWTNADIDQPADRCHRIGQKDTVNIYFLIANGTVENKIIKNLDKNRAVVKKLLDGKDVEEDDLLSNLLKDYIDGDKKVIE